MRQHLTSIKAAAEICNAKTQGLELGAKAISFMPNEIKAGQYRFEIGSAGGTSLVAQTIIPILSHAKKVSTVTITGGTHNLWAPTYDYLDLSFLPLFNKMGGQANIELEKYGFYPAGGGEITVFIKPATEKFALDLTSRGEKRGAEITAILANLRNDIAIREIKTIAHRMNMDKTKGVILEVDGPGPGNVVTLAIDYENITELFIGHGTHGVRAEAVANGVVDEARAYFTSEAAVDIHMADQLLLPMALFAGGVFTTPEMTGHTRTNIEIIKQFLDVEIQTKQLARKLWKISVKL